MFPPASRRILRPFTECAPPLHRYSNAPLIHEVLKLFRRHLGLCLRAHDFFGSPLRKPNVTKTSLRMASIT
jgi:hypothetical protein